MSVAEGGKMIFGGIPQTPEEVHAVCFSDQARERHQQRYPDLSAEQVTDAVDRVSVEAEGAKVHRFFPIFVERELRQVAESVSNNQKKS